MSSESNTERDQWLADRRKGIGGSDAGAILEVSPYRTPLDVYLDKTGRAEPIEDNDAMFWGRTLEDIVARVYAERTGHKIRRKGMMTSKAHPFMLGNLDRVIVGEPGGPGVLEVKTAGQYATDQWGEPGTDQVPEAYYAQLAHYMAVTGYKWARLAVLIGGRDFRIYDIPRDEDLINSLIEIERTFWEECVVPDCPPDARTSADIAKLWPKDSGREVIASAEILEAVTDLKDVKARIHLWEKRKTDLEDEIKTYMQDATTLVDDAGMPLATWKAQESRRLDSKKIKWMLGDDLPDFQTTSTSRVLRIK